MKTLASFSIRYTLVIVVCVGGAIAVHYYMTFFGSPSVTSLFPAQYFQDMDTSNTSLVYATKHIETEMQFAPYAGNYLRKTLASLLILLLLFTICYPIYFLFKRRGQLRVQQKVCVFLISGGLFFVSVFLLMMAPRYALTPVLKYAQQQLRTRVYQPENSGAITDPREIARLLKRNTIPVHIISGYGKYNLALRDLTHNPFQHKLTYYKSMFLPTAAYALMLQEQHQDETNSDQKALYYYPETHQLVINEVLDQDQFLEVLSVDLINDRGYASLTQALLKKGLPKDYRIVNAANYAQFYVQKTIENNEKAIKTDQAAYAGNLAVLAECSQLQKSNNELVAEQTADYQKNCVDRTRYSNCAEFKNTIEDNKRIAAEAILSCQNKSALIAQYNQEIEESIEISRKRITDATTQGSLERNMSESSDGVFMRPSMIYLRGSGLIHQTLMTSVHEFLHFAVHSAERDIPTFIDEGMTDYLARSSFGYTKYQVTALSGYYAEVQILYSLLERVPFQEMLDVYISGKETQFKKLFEKYFPEASYDQFIQLGTKTYNTTYAFESEARTFNFYAAEREYVWLEDVRAIRSLLGLESYVSYSDLESMF